MLDAGARRAAKELSARLGITPSEAVRRALVSYRELVVGPSPARRRARVAALRKLGRLFDGHDAAEEISALKAERARS